MSQACDNVDIDNARHVFLHCNFVNAERCEMFRAIDSIPNGIGKTIMTNSVDILFTLLGKPSFSVSKEQHMIFLKVIVKFMSEIYRKIVRERNGIG